MAGIKLSRRLQAAADAVRPGARVADVGCDHGRLSAWLVQSGKSPFATAIDIREKPLQKAAALFEKCGLTRVTATLQSDGLRDMAPDVVDDVVIAGLGFDTVAGIIQEAPWLKDRDKRLVLVPASQHARLRRWLCGEGFEITEEQPVCEGRNCYTVMAVRYTGRVWQPGAVYAAIGILKPGSDDYDAYLDRVYNAAQKVVAALSGGEKYRDAKAVVEHIERIRNTNG